MAKKKAPAGGISKMDAVRQAMSELGNAATRTEIQKFVKVRFGVEMNLDVVSSYKAFIASKAKKTAAKSPAAIPVPPEPAAAKPPEAKPVVLKPEAVTTPAAMPIALKPAAATTPEAKPVPKQPAAASKKRKKKEKRAKAAPKPVALIVPAPSVEATGISLNDIQTVKELVKRVGVNTLKGLIDVFGK